MAVSLTEDFNGLPLLPAIEDEALRTAVFTHKSFESTQAGLLKDMGEMVNNERLAFLGDSVFAACVSKYLFDNYPLHRVGIYTTQRSLVVSKERLSRWAVDYGLTRDLRCHASNRMSIEGSIDVQASLFQAYVAAVFQEGGVKAVTNWIGPLMLTVIDMEEARTSELKHAMSAKTTQVGHQSARLDQPQAPPVITQKGYLAMLHEMLTKQGIKVEQLEWKEVLSGPPHLPTWNVDVFASVGDGKEFLGSGVGSRKQGAKEAAAKEALQLLKNKPQIVNKLSTTGRLVNKQ